MSVEFILGIVYASILIVPILVYLVYKGILKYIHVYYPKCIYTSKVPGHEGLCVVTWINHSELDMRLTGIQTGFFRSVKNVRGARYKRYGEEFHGYLAKDNCIKSTEGM